jgi:hypothetical protein
MFNSEVKAMKVHGVLVSGNLFFNSYAHVGMWAHQAPDQP